MYDTRTITTPIMHQKVKETNLGVLFIHIFDKVKIKLERAK